MNDKLFKKIRGGSEEEAQDVYNNLMKTTLGGAVVSIMNRNFSHPIGQFLAKLFKKKRKK